MSEADRQHDVRLLTMPEAARGYHIPVTRLRREARAGSFPVYDLGTSWHRVYRHELEVWIRSTRVPPTDHARRVVDRVLEREARTAERTGN